MRRFRAAAWFAAYLVVLLLALIWAADGLVALKAPLLDIGRRDVGDGIIRMATLLGLSPAGVMNMALALAGMKLMISAFLLLTVSVASYEWRRFGASDNAMLDVGIFLSAVASAIAALPVMAQGGIPLQAALGEMLLCVIASGLAWYGRGYMAPAVSTRVMAPG
jgi:hypothetical protein